MRSLLGVAAKGKQGGIVSVTEELLQSRHTTWGYDTQLQQTVNSDVITCCNQQHTLRDHGVCISYNRYASVNDTHHVVRVCVRGVCVCVCVCGVCVVCVCTREKEIQNRAYT